MAAHVHQWILVRTETRKNGTYKFYECVAAGCPNPNRMEIER